MANNLFRHPKRASDYCVVCSNNSKKNPEYSFFRFPKDEDRCNKWKVKLELVQLDSYSSEQCYKQFRICSAHFEEKMFSSIQKNRLKRDAVPTIIEYSKHSSGESAMCLQKSAEFEALPSTSYSEPRPEDTLCSSPIGVNNSQPVMKLIPCLPARCLTDYSDCFPQFNEMGNESTGQKPVYQSNYSEPTEFEEESDRIERASSPSRSGSIIRKRGPVPEHIEDFEESDLEVKSKRHQYWNLSQQTFQKYRKRINYLRTKLKKQNDKIRAMNSILNDLRKT